MTDVQTVAMHDVLIDVGFEPNSQLLSDYPGGLSLDMGGGLILKAVHNMNFSCERGITLSGIYRTSRELTMIEYRLPEHVSSAALGVALMAYCLDKYLGRTFQPEVAQYWLEQGRRDRHILPWEIARAADEALPRCSADPRWNKVTIADLRERLPKEAPTSSVEFAFDGHVLSISIGETVLPLPAIGKAWKQRYRISAVTLSRELPSRLRPRSNCFIVRDGELTLGYHRLGPVEILNVEAGDFPPPLRE